MSCVALHCHLAAMGFPASQINDITFSSALQVEKQFAFYDQVAANAYSVIAYCVAGRNNHKHIILYCTYTIMRSWVLCLLVIDLRLFNISTYLIF